MAKQNKQNNVNVLGCKKSVLELTMTCKAACAAINTILDEQFENNGNTLTVREWMALMDYKWGKKGLTPAALFSVWHKEMKLDNGDVCLWRKVPAKVMNVDADGKETEKTVYEWVEEKKQHRMVGEYKLVKVEKWTPAVILNALIASWNYAKVLNTNSKNHDHIESIKKFYVNGSKTATRKGSKSTMVEVTKEEVVF